MLPGERVDLIRAIYSSLTERETGEVILILREFGFAISDPEFWDTDIASTVQETLRHAMTQHSSASGTTSTAKSWSVRSVPKRNDVSGQTAFGSSLLTRRLTPTTSRR